ncbi:MAG TPA: hypothetical protein VHN77_14385 [Phycisphaerales bacterium]|nr:hypothetical protein [Phycisphaerales bacterium]
MSTLEMEGDQIGFDIFQDWHGNRFLSEHDGRRPQESPESAGDLSVGRVTVESSFSATTSEWSFLVLVLTGTRTTHMLESITSYGQVDTTSADLTSNNASDLTLEWLKTVKAYTRTPKGDEFLGHLRSPKPPARHSLLTPAVWLASILQPLLIVGVGVSLWLARARFREERRHAQNLCPNCSYPRESHARCPECGETFTPLHTPQSTP